LVARVRAFEWPDDRRERWEARIDLTPTGWEVVRRFRRELGSGAVEVMISAGGSPIDVVLAGQMAVELRVGAFSSLEELRRVFPGAEADGGTSGADQSSDARLRLLKERADEDERLMGRVDALVDAAIAGDDETVDALLQELPQRP
jgi:hypothetical protein